MRLAPIGPGEEQQPAVNLLLRFEAALTAALKGKEIENTWSGSSAADRLLRVVEDICWALVRPRSTRPRYPISVLRVRPFLFHPPTRNNSAMSHALALTTIENRQALLAATLAILRPDLTRGMLFSKAPPECDPLITLFNLLPEDNGAALLKRSGSWPGRLRQRITTSLINNQRSRALGPGRGMAARPGTPQAPHALKATNTESRF